MHNLRLKAISADVVADSVNPTFRYSLLVLFKADIANILQTDTMYWFMRH